MTLTAQAAIQLAIGTAFSIDDIVRGDYIGATIAIVISAIPFAGRVAKFGTKAPMEFMSKYGAEMAKIKDMKALDVFFKSLKEDEKILLTRALKQTPAELKKSTSALFANTLKEGVKNGTIELSKIPLKQKLWWKEIFVEGGLGLTTGVGFSLADAIYDEQK